MTFSKTFRRNIVNIFAIASIVISANTCSLDPQKSFPFETNVIVYADLNANGGLDKGEPPIPGVVVTLVSFLSDKTNQSNGKPVDGIQNDDDSIVVLADESGQVTFSGKTFRYYEIGVLKPCGYHAIHVPRQMFAKSVAVYEVGYVPDNPQSGTSTIGIHFWFDQDGNGKQTPGEDNITNADIKLWTTWEMAGNPGDGGGSGGYDFNLKTDNEGKVMLEMGNVCDTFHVADYSIQKMLVGTSLETTYLSPFVKVIDYENDRKIDLYEFNTSIGVTSIEWGLRVTGSK